MRLLRSPSRTPTRELVLLLVLTGLVAGLLIHTLRDQQRMAGHWAELNDIEYGLLNADAWVQQLSAIVDKKIDEFEVTPENRVALKANLERVLRTLITEADRRLRRQKNGEGWWQRSKGKMKQRVRDSLIDMEEIKRGVPAYADQILNEMSKPAARQQLKGFLKDLLDDASRSTFSSVDETRILAVQTAYHCSDRAACALLLETQVEAAQIRARYLAWSVFGLALLLFGGVASGPPPRGPHHLALLAACSAVLMVCGVLTPMLEVEARITQLDFMLLGEPVTFTDQILYFQSKSVLDVVAILAATGAPDMILVGILLILFSVIFPTAKLAASLIHVYNLRGWRDAALIRFFALKSGKWSMADVFVIAMFMAYIGFSGLAANQLEDFAAAGGDEVEVLTTNGTSLEIGFYMFLAFCIAGLVTSTLIEADDAWPAGASTNALAADQIHDRQQDQRSEE